MATGHRKADAGINVGKLTTELQEKLDSSDWIMSSRCCIFRVPSILSRHNPKAYAPNAFSIGPFHYGKPGLLEADKIKFKYLHHLVSRTCAGANQHHDDKSSFISRLIGVITEIHGEAREHYAGDIDMSMDEFVKVLVIDGCFLIELFRKGAYGNLDGESDDPIFGMSCMLEFLYHDLILLENQIPWLVLDRLFNDTKTQIDILQLVDLAVLFFSMSSAISCIIRESTNRIVGNKHILDLLRNSMVPLHTTSIIEDTAASTLGQITMPSVTNLKEAGIKFMNSPSTQSIINITFKDGVLEIPPLTITEITETLFRNLISFEQCLPHCPGIVTSYAILLDNLINTSKDMEILCKNDVITNWLNIEDATKFFNQLYNDTFIKQYHYIGLACDVNKYCQRRWPRYRTVLMHDYFKHPWALISVIAATILLILTFLQTLVAII